MGKSGPRALLSAVSNGQDEELQLSHVVYESLAELPLPLCASSTSAGFEGAVHDGIHQCTLSEQWVSQAHADEGHDMSH